MPTPFPSSRGDAPDQATSPPSSDTTSRPQPQPTLSHPLTASPTTMNNEKHLPTMSSNSAPPSARPYAQPTEPQHAPSSTEAGPSRPTLLSTYLAQHPTHTVGQAMRHHFPRPNPIKRLARRFKVKHSVIEGMKPHEEQHWEAQATTLRRKAGWKVDGEEGGTEVSDLFWKMYLSLMPTMARDPLSGLCPPDLLGSTTTIPLSIISLIPDIMQHYRDVIIRAEKEIFLVTNYWQPSASVNTVSGALRDLSAKVVKAGRPKVIVKIMYDRGSWEQLWNAHAPVPPKEWAPLDLPKEQDIPGLSLEVINFHRVLLGTFHAKFLIVDRKVVLINSNNIQDRPNLEMMTHLEGPVVDSFYEIALHSWYNRLSPMLPHIDSPYSPPRDSLGNIRYLFQDHNPYFDEIEILKAAKAARLLLRRQTKDANAEAARNTESHGQADKLVEAVRRVMEQQRQSFADWKPSEEFEARRQQLREFTKGLGLQSRGPSRGPSRSGSRGPSRRSSANEKMLRSFRYQDQDPQTAAITARNAQLTQHLAEPSEAPSSPTVVGETPLKSKTMPEPHADGHFEPSDSVTPTGSGHPTPRVRPADAMQHPHVSFIRTDSAGVAPKVLDGDMMESPTSSTVHLPQSAISATSARQAPLVPSPILKDTQNSQPPSPMVLPMTGMPPPSPLARSSPLAVELPRGRQPASTSSRPDTPTESRSRLATDQTGRTGQTGISTPVSSTPAQDGFRPSTDLDRRFRHVHMDEALPRHSLERKETEPPEGTGSRRMFKLSKKFNAGALSDAWATVEDSDELDNFRPHIVHAPHEPVPVAMCCRKPHGFPGHHDIRNPQNAAWLAGFRYAKEKVFIQSPTLNARPIVRAVKQACRRGVQVELLLDLGFNDKGESIPFQGGTNEEVVDRLYKILRKEGKEQFLKVYWYTGKDQVRPLNAVKKQRNCHIKFAAYDDQVLIMGNGNQDSQSWFHSQEINIMVDSKQIVAEMMDTLLGNQNTIQYGLVDSDGVWRDKEGKTLVDYGATDKGLFRGLSGFIAFAKTI